MPYPYRISVALLFSLIFFYPANLSAQSVDRTQLLNELVALRDQLKATSDPAQIQELQKQFDLKEQQFLSPAPEDLAAAAGFLQQPDTGLIRLLPRGKYEQVLLIRGAGAYYYFPQQTHIYGYGSDLELQQGDFLVGFAGADFGFLVSLANTPLEGVTLDHPGVQFLANYKAPNVEAEAREQAQLSGTGVQADGFTYKSRLTAALDTTYAVRSIVYRGSDALVAFRVVRQDTDGSLILRWKLLKRYATPQLNGNFVATASAASYGRSALGRESIVAAFGTDLSTVTAAADKLPLPEFLGGTSVSIQSGTRSPRRAKLFSVAPGQVNFLITPDIPDGPAIVSITNANGGRVYENVRIVPSAPGLFSANADAQGVAAAVALRITGNQQTYEPVSRFDSAQNRAVSIPIDLGPSADQVVLVLFGTGIRFYSSPAAVSVKIGGVDAPVLFAGAQGGEGVDQVNVIVPRSLAGRGEVDVVLTVDGQAANTVKVNIR